MHRVLAEPTCTITSQVRKDGLQEISVNHKNRDFKRRRERISVANEEAQKQQKKTGNLRSRLSIPYLPSSPSAITVYGS